MGEKLCLKWNDFQENVNTAFGSLREEKEFADVTLDCEDGKQIEAHKVILAASSPFFENLLKRNKHPCPLIYMRGIKSENLLACYDMIIMSAKSILHFKALKYICFNLSKIYFVIHMLYILLF